MKGKGPALPDPVLGSLTLPVTAQLRNTQTGVCMQGVYDTGDVIKNDSALTPRSAACPVAPLPRSRTAPPRTAAPPRRYVPHSGMNRSVSMDVLHETFAPRRPSVRPWVEQSQGEEMATITVYRHQALPAFKVLAVATTTLVFAAALVFVLTPIAASLSATMAEALFRLRYSLMAFDYWAILPAVGLFTCMVFAAQFPDEITSFLRSRPAFAWLAMSLLTGIVYTTLALVLIGLNLRAVLWGGSEWAWLILLMPLIPFLILGVLLTREVVRAIAARGER
jgi:hypothetical protein